MKTFKDLKLNPSLLKVLDEKGFTTPTEIQALAIPHLLSPDMDFHGQAQTGTGKTLAFGLPLLQNIDTDSKTTQALVIAPTRELVVQIADSLKEFQKALPGLKILTVYGGASMGDQVRELKRGVQIIIGTPGRLKDHIRRKTLSLKDLKVLVLDEADTMLDMGFKDDVEDILKTAHKDRSIWLFSATVKRGIRDLMNKYMPNAVSERVSQQGVGTHRTKQYYCVMPRRERVAAICRFIDSVKNFYGFIFCPTKILTAEIAEELAKRGYNALPLHGDMSQPQRNKVIKRFKDKDVQILVCTDVAARGIDVADTSHVINYALPDDEENYVHRIGRTGRAGKEGIAITFATNSEMRVIRNLEKKFHVSIEKIDVPSLADIADARLEMAKEYLSEKPEVDKSLKPSFKKIEDLIAGLSEEERSQALVTLVYNKFLKPLGNDSISAPREQSGDGRALELSLNVGSEDGLSRDDIVAYIENYGKVSETDLTKVKVSGRRTFIGADLKVIRELQQSLRGHKLGGRQVMTSLIDDQGQRSQRSGRQGGRSFGGRQGGRQRDRDGGGRKSGDRRSSRSR